MTSSSLQDALNDGTPSAHFGHAAGLALRNELPEREIVPGMVSIVVLNYKGAPDTITCVQALSALDWPAERLEIVVIDNDSGDGSLEAITQACPDATVVDSGANLGFAGGCNFGVQLARGEYIGLINNDARPDRGWVRAAVAEFERDRTVASVASKVLNWAGDKIDYVDASLTWFGMGYKRETEHPDTGAYETPKDVLFGTGSAVFFRAATFRQVGGFDERFFMFYEDVDLGWRLNLLGQRVRYVPASIAFHKHHATMKQYGRYRETYLLERNALLSMYKNYDDETLARFLPAAMALAVRRTLAAHDIDARMLDLQVRPGGDTSENVEIPKGALAGPLAIDYLVEQLPSLIPDRAELQRRRKRSDRDLFTLFRQAIEPAYPYPAYLAAHRHLLEAFGIEDYLTRRRRVLVITGEPLGAKMAGPAIRAFEISRVLSDENDVVLASLGPCSLEGEGFETVSASRRGLVELVDNADVVILQGLLLSLHPWVKDADAVLIADIYDPFHLETLEQERNRTLRERDQISRDTVDALNVQLARCDYFMCASEKQRDFWLGQLAGQDRINPLNYDRDESLRTLIDVVPFGLPDAPPVQKKHGIKGAIPGIGPDDKVILWGGGVYNWFDPLTLVKAIDRVRHKVPNVRLVFMGMKHPNPGVPAMAMADHTRELSANLKLTGKHVFFNESWIPYEDRADLLLDADVGVSCHFDHVETEFSFRTRILDYLWAGLPIVCTSGDAFGDLVEREGLGATVPPEDVEALAAALIHLLTDDADRALVSDRVRQVAVRFTWRSALAPLVQFVRSPERAPDIRSALGSARLSEPRHTRPRKAFDVREDAALMRQYLREGGVGELTARAAGRVRRVLRERNRD